MRPLRTFTIEPSLPEELKALLDVAHSVHRVNSLSGKGISGSVSVDLASAVEQKDAMVKKLCSGVEQLLKGRKVERWLRLSGGHAVAVAYPYPPPNYSRQRVTVWCAVVIVGASSSSPRGSERKTGENRNGGNYC